ncbi:hypothetical protein [Marinomonas balearica]|uniref:Uncharacterized protein n=1 Tax=Marinomonas balearica TaxID=491947 RepID=A0A4R6MFT0_9GAMM|nr:hypothetical protein [Marinomonas balearica]TDP00485.1 hypothetical protein DFP79_0294 [Marinomonas balearica]
MKYTFTPIASVCLVFLSYSAQANEFAPEIKAHLEDTAMAWINNPMIIDAIKAQNRKHINISNAEIDALDKEWRAGVNGGDTSLIDSVLSRPVSSYLEGVKAEHEDLYTEIFIMDNKGLNVGQSDITSDYWQGDEAKWQKTYSMGPGAVNIGELEEDESTGAFQSQLNSTIVDPNTGAAIGAITIGISLDGL